MTSNGIKMWDIFDKLFVLSCEVAQVTIKEDKIYDKDNNVINLSAIPNDIILSNVNLNKDKTTFTCMVNKKSAFFSVIRKPCIFITISDNGKNIDISRATEKIEVDKKYRIFYTIMNSIGISAFMVFILFIFILPLIESISSRISSFFERTLITRIVATIRTVPIASMIAAF